MKYDIAKFGSNIIPGGATDKIANEILDLLSSNDSLSLNFERINLMTTRAAKEILKPIVDRYGIEQIFKKIHFCNVADDLKIVISTAIDSL
ncbi:MAG: hypothetical protein J6K96_06775 [Treponema sp.]|nr:hypothetical protein [Treponema sp.]